MNCNQVEELLPLYVSRDLEAAREQSVAAHLESCAACSGAAGEYRQTWQLLQEFAPPAGSEDVYDSIRQNVWRQIESQSRAGSGWDDVFSLFRPRLAWALAAVLVIAVAAFGIFRMTNRESVPGRTAATAPAMNPNTLDKDFRSAEREGQALPAKSNEPANNEAGVLNSRTARPHTRRNVIRNRPVSVAVAPSAPHPAADTSTNVNTFTLSEAGAGNTSEKTLRMEIQTRNPNIRIIWFSQTDQKRTSSNSKGI